MRWDWYVKGQNVIKKWVMCRTEWDLNYNVKIITGKEQSSGVGGTQIWPRNIITQRHQASRVHAVDCLPVAGPDWGRGGGANCVDQFWLQPAQRHRLRSVHVEHPQGDSFRAIVLDIGVNLHRSIQLEQPGVYIDVAQHPQAIVGMFTVSNQVPWWSLLRQQSVRDRRGSQQRKTDWAGNASVPNSWLQLVRWGRILLRVSWLALQCLPAPKLLPIKQLHRR